MLIACCGRARLIVGERGIAKLLSHCAWKANDFPGRRPQTSQALKPKLSSPSFVCRLADSKPLGCPNPEIQTTAPHNLNNPIPVTPAREAQHQPKNEPSLQSLTAWTTGNPKRTSKKLKLDNPAPKPRLKHTHTLTLKSRNQNRP